MKPDQSQPAQGATGERRVYEGRAQVHHDGIEWWSLEEDDDVGNCSSDASWFDDLEDQRVRITVEVAPFGETADEAYARGFAEARSLYASYLRPHTEQKGGGGDG